MKKISGNLPGEGRKSVSLKAKSTLPFLTLFISVITACSTGNLASTAKVDLNKSNLTGSQQPVTIDVGKGKLGASSPVKLNITNGFKTKANINGFDGKFTSVSRFNIVLVSTAGTGSNDLTSSTLPSGTSADIFSITKALLITHGNTVTDNSPSDSFAEIMLKNVTAGTYFVAVAAYDSIDVNQTKATGTTCLISSEKYAVSTGGGDGSGSVTITGNSVSNTATITIPLTLNDSYGATVDSTVNVSESALPSITVQ